MNVEFQNVIVTIDLSDFSERVVAQARKISETLGKPLSFLFVESEINTDLGHLKNLILEKYKILSSSDLYIRFGDPAQKILEFSEEFSSPLIVAGHRGGHRVAEFFLGSVVKQLALRTKNPLWIYRGSKVGIPKKIMLPLALDQRSEALLQVGHKLEKMFKAEIEVFHSMRLPSASVDTISYGAMYEAFKEMDEKAIQQFKETFPNIKIVSVDGEPGFEIKEHARYFDLLVLAPSYRGTKIPFFGTTTTHLLNTGETSILVVPRVLRT